MHGFQKRDLVSIVWIEIRTGQRQTGSGPFVAGEYGEEGGTSRNSAASAPCRRN